MSNKAILVAYGKLVISYNQLYGDLYDIVNDKQALSKFEPYLRNISYG